MWRVVRGAPCVLGVAVCVALVASRAAAQGAPTPAEARYVNEVAVSARTPPARVVVGALPIPERAYAVESLRLAPDLGRVPTRPRSVSPLLAAGIALTLQVAIWSWSRFVTEDDWARISLESWRANLRGPWIFDRSNYATNQFAHPYHGALSFTAARASGLGFWASLPYPFVASTLWELFGETEPPAINDAITTPVGGALLGEALHRIAAMFLDAGGARPGIGWSLAAAAVDPVGGAVRLVAGERFRSRDEQPIPAHLELSAGVSFAGRAEVGERNVRTAGLGLLQARVTHGLPVPGWILRRPFDHFDLSLVLVLAAKPWFQLTLRGLLLGASWENGLSRGFYGLFGVFEALAPPVFRTATSALAFGATGGGSLCVFASTRAHVIVDVLGVWVPTPAAPPPTVVPGVDPDAPDDPRLPDGGLTDDGGTDGGRTGTPRPLTTPGCALAQPRTGRATGAMSALLVVALGLVVGRRARRRSPI